MTTITENNDSIDSEILDSYQITPAVLADLIENHKSFTVIGVKDIGTVVTKIENAIDKAKHSCRVYTEYRTAGLAGMVLPTVLTQIVGLGTLVGIGLHNFCTMNPDFEIGKNPINHTVVVSYKK